MNFLRSLLKCALFFCCVIWTSLGEFTSFAGVADDDWASCSHKIRCHRVPTNTSTYKFGTYKFGTYDLECPITKRDSDAITMRLVQCVINDCRKSYQYNGQVFMWKNDKAVFVDPESKTTHLEFIVYGLCQWSSEAPFIGNDPKY